MNKPDYLGLLIDENLVKLRSMRDQQRITDALCEQLLVLIDEMRKTKRLIETQNERGAKCGKPMNLSGSSLEVSYNEEETD